MVLALAMPFGGGAPLAPPGPGGTVFTTPTPDLWWAAAAGTIRLHPSKTSGDYARELHAGGSPVHGEFRQFGRRYDRVLFGVGTCDAATYATLREQAARLIRPEARAA